MTFTPRRDSPSANPDAKKALPTSLEVIQGAKTKSFCQVLPLKRSPPPMKPPPPPTRAVRRVRGLRTRERCSLRMRRWPWLMTSCQKKLSSKCKSRPRRVSARRSCVSLCIYMIYVRCLCVCARVCGVCRSRPRRVSARRSCVCVCVSVCAYI